MGAPVGMGALTVGVLPSEHSSSVNEYFVLDIY
jgi:hypothetical protein